MSSFEEMQKTVNSMNEKGTIFSRGLAEQIKREFEQTKKDQSALQELINYEVKGLKQVDKILMDTEEGVIPKMYKKIQAYSVHNQDAAENTAKACEAAKKTEEWFKTVGLGQVRTNLIGACTVMLTVFSLLITVFVFGSKKEENNVSISRMIEIQKEINASLKEKMTHDNLVMDEMIKFIKVKLK